MRGTGPKVTSASPQPPTQDQPPARSPSPSTATRRESVGRNDWPQFTAEVAAASSHSNETAAQALHKARAAHPDLWSWHLLNGDGGSCSDPGDRTLPTGLRWVVAQALQPSETPLTHDCFDEALAQHPGSHYLDSIMLHARSDPRYDSEAFPAFIKQWRPHIDAHPCLPTLTPPAAATKALEADWKAFQSLLCCITRWASRYAVRLTEVEAAAALRSARSADPSDLLLSGALPAYDPDRLLLHPALCPPLASELRAFGHVIHLNDWDLALARTDWSPFASASVAHLQSLPFGPLSDGDATEFLNGWIADHGSTPSARSFKMSATLPKRLAKRLTKDCRAQYQPPRSASEIDSMSCSSGSHDSAHNTDSNGNNDGSSTETARPGTRQSTGGANDSTCARDRNDISQAAPPRRSTRSRKSLRTTGAPSWLTLPVTLSAAKRSATSASAFARSVLPARLHAPPRSHHPGPTLAPRRTAHERGGESQ